ncbi:von willebrand factor type A domain protein (macronuclear) [Tetrahymena thermophila SB210]|uniref:von willebrand factor type A domain protein n=1 Tax=Tetrahymena thermophila (strain SB210) TaxID=312017 RepID=Q22MK9_TETTS|nr:von willebrand factor type A domain protein [Tetrahymena thermophila SB210]EAR86350.1 von willebrand factor type A domain protein [Tetrahymena thermophila SB210]|eukprot:XP_977011.1 von willebrand factor type A domain protein [Tetrahymena thermophila SB210]
MSAEQQETCCKVFRNYKNVTLEECKSMGLDVSIKSKKKYIPRNIENEYLVNMMISIRGQSKLASVQSKIQSEASNKGISYLILLDRSESMQVNQKIQNAKKSVIELIQNLTPYDRFCLIPFGGSNGVAIPFTDSNSINKQETFEIIQNIVCKGKTDIVSVIQTAINTIKQEQIHQNTIKQEFEKTTKKSLQQSINSSLTRVSRNINVDELELLNMSKKHQNKNSSNQIVDRTYCFVLLSDGEDNIHQNYALQRIRECIKNETLNYSINCFGFGIEHDGNLLSSIAQLTGGQYYYIKENESIYDYLKECKNLQGDILFENVEIQIDSNQRDSVNQIINTEIVDLPSNFIQIAKQNSYKANFQHIQSNSENKIFFSIKVNKSEQQNYQNFSSSSSSSDTLSSFNSSSSRSITLSQEEPKQKEMIDLTSIEKLILGTIKISFSKKDDKQNYMSVQTPVSIEVSKKHEYEIDVLKEITNRIFSNILENSIQKAFTGNSENAKFKLEQLKTQIVSYQNNLKIEEFKRNVEIIDFILQCLSHKDINNNTIYQRQLKLLTQEIVFYYKYNSQKSQKISEKIDQVLQKQELFFNNELTNMLTQQTLKGNVN